MTPTPVTSTSRSPNHRRPQGRPKRALLPWLTFVLPAVVIVGLAVATTVAGPDTTVASGRAASFTLPDTVGGTFELDDALEGGDTLLYFSMGVGCDGCFAQIPEIVDVLDTHDIQLASIMVDPAPAVANEAARFGITDPILIDADRAVSQAYGMLGVYGHTDRPSHSFALVRRDGTIAAVEHYATMFVPATQLLTDLGITTPGS